MNHEYLNGDAMKEIIKDESVDLFISYPPFLGIDTERYSSAGKQINSINDAYVFSKRLLKVAKNCYKALKTHGNFVLILPSHTPELLWLVYRFISKKTKFVYNGTLVWNYRNPDYRDNSQISADYCNIIWFSKGMPKVNQMFIEKNPDGVINFPLKPDALVERYGQMGHVWDAMPEDLAEHLIELFSLPEDTVADVLGGTGTLSIAAENTGRNSIYNDISFVQLTIAKKRMEDLIAIKKRMS